MAHSLDRFDLAIGTAILVLATLIGGVILHGDQIGIQIEQITPTDTASVTAAIQITFDEPVALNTARDRLKIEPTVPGDLSVMGNQITFRPTVPLQPNQSYTVTVQAGITALTGRQLKQDKQWRFTVRSPRIVYLGPEDDRNLYVFDPAVPGSPQRLTDSQIGIASYDVLPDGSKIIYAELPDQGTTNLYVWNAATSTSTLLYTCQEATCANPVWRPDGSAVAFEQIADTGTISRAPRVYIFDIAANAARPLLKDSQIVNSQPRWSPDGKWLAVVSDLGLIIRDVASDKDTTIETPEGEVAAFSPDSKWLIYRRRVSPSPGMTVTHLTLVDLSNGLFTQRPLETDDDQSNDLEAVWRPDSRALIVVRRPLTKGAPAGSHIYNVQIEGGIAKQLLADETHRHRDIRLSPAEDRLIFGRIPLVRSAGGSGLWVYTFSSGDLALISENGSDARWLP